MTLKAGVLAFFISYLSFPVVLIAGSECIVYIYGFADSPSTKLIVKHFSQRGCEIVFLELNESCDKFMKIVEALRLLGVQVIPPEQCIQCMLLHRSWNEILTSYASPLICFFHDGRLKAITVGIISSEILTEASSFRDKYVKVFSLNNEYAISGEDAARLENLILGEKEPINITSKMLSSIVLLALADSINPCTFTVFTALLLISLHSLGRLKAALTGISFISAIYICYYMLGLGLIQALTGFPYAEKIVAIFGLIIGAISIAHVLKPEFKSPIPKTLRNSLEKFLEKAYFSPAASFILGVLASFTLLPCSCGPYIVSLGILSILKEKIQAHLLLALYNTIMVAPLLMILLSVLATKRYARKVKILRGRRGIMEFTGGLILIIICLIILFSSGL